MRRIHRCGGRSIWRALATLGELAGLCSAAFAADGSLDPTDLERPRLEFWSGAQAYHHVWSLYSGATLAPFGAIQEDGMRLRLVAGYGADSYAGLAKFRATDTFADALLGYHTQQGPMTLKVFAGVMATNFEDSVGAHSLGGKVALETWWNIGEVAWTSVDLSWGSLHQSYAARSRIGWRVNPALSAGLEAGAAGNIEDDVVRVGGFLRYEVASGEIAVSGGAATDRPLEAGGTRALARASTPYAMLSWLTRF